MVCLSMDEMYLGRGGFEVGAGLGGEFPPDCDGGGEFCDGVEGVRGFHVTPQFCRADCRVTGSPGQMHPSGLFHPWLGYATRLP